MADRGLLEVQGVQMGGAVDALDAGHAGQILKLVGIRGIDDHGLRPEVPGELIGKLGAQGRRVHHAVCAGARMLKDHLVDVVNAALDIHKAAAPADKHVHPLKGDLVFLEELQDHVPAVRELGGHVGIFGKLRRVMGDIFGEEAFIILKQCDFCGSGTGIDRKNANCHPRILRFIFSCRPRGRRR